MDFANPVKEMIVCSKYDNTRNITFIFEVTKRNITLRKRNLFGDWSDIPQCIITNLEIKARDTLKKK